jgi:hypothetical protein
MGIGDYPGRRQPVCYSLHIVKMAKWVAKAEACVAKIVMPCDAIIDRKKDFI